MQRNRFFGRFLCPAIFLAIFGFLVFGCGGGGGGSTSGSSANGSSANGTTSNGTTSNGTTSNGTTAGVVNVALVAVFQSTNARANTISASSSTLQLGVGDKIQLEYVGQSSTDSTVYKVVSGGALSTNAPSSVATLSGALLSVVKSSTPTTYTIVGSYNGTVMTLTYTTVGQLAKASGVVKDGNGNVVIGAPVAFYSGATAVGFTKTATDGSFIGDVPVGTKTFSVDLSAYSTLYFNEYAYGNFAFSKPTACYTPLPTLTAGKTVALPHQVVPFFYFADSPPPPPAGCG